LLFLFALLLFQLLNLELLLLDFPLLIAELLLDPLAPSPPCLRFSSVFIVSLGPACLFCSRFLVANFGPPNLANAVLDGLSINELVNDLGGLVIHAGSFEGTINQSSGLGAVERQELVRVALDFLLGNFEDCLCHLCLVVLCKRCS